MKRKLAEGRVFVWIVQVSPRGIRELKIISEARHRSCLGTDQVRRLLNFTQELTIQQVLVQWQHKLHPWLIWQNFHSILSRKLRFIKKHSETIMDYSEWSMYVYMYVCMYEGQSISNASYYFHLYFARKLKYNYIAWKPQHWRLICHFSI